MDQVEVDIAAARPALRRLLAALLGWPVGALRDPDLMARIIQTAPDLETAAHRLVEAANHSGGRDNIAVALLRVTERARHSLLSAPHTGDHQNRHSPRSKKPLDQLVQGLDLF